MLTTCCTVMFPHDSISTLIRCRESLVDQIAFDLPRSQASVDYKFPKSRCTDPFADGKMVLYLLTKFREDELKDSARRVKSVQSRREYLGDVSVGRTISTPNSIHPANL